MTSEDLWLPPDFASSLADLFDPLDGFSGQIPFYCDREVCDGRPHDGHDWQPGDLYRPDFGYRHARAPQQRQVIDPALDWFIMLYLGGRGSGKTRNGAEWLVESMIQPVVPTYWGIVTPTFDDGRDIAMGGESGVLPVLERRKIRYNWNKNLGILDLLDNNAKCELYADSNPERLRGPNLSGAWCDEPGSWRNALGTSSAPGTWPNLMMMCRIGKPHIFVSGTPKPTKFVTTLRDKASILVTGSSYDNKDNLAKVWYDEVVKPLEGTSLGQQEIEGKILEAIDGALWKRDWITIKPDDMEIPRMRIVRLGWDPAITSHAKSDAHGIVVSGLAVDGSTWVLDDVSDILSPDSAAKRVLQTALKWGVALISYEPNQGGDTWEILLKHAATGLGIPAHQIPRMKKTPSSISKEARAQPIAQVYESPAFKVIHARAFDLLEIEMCTWVPKETTDSPDRLDALVLSIDALGHATGTRSLGMAARTQASAAGVTRRSSRRSMAAVMSKNRSAMARRVGR